MFHVLSIFDHNLLVKLIEKKCLQIWNQYTKFSQKIKTILQITDNFFVQSCVIIPVMHLLTWYSLRFKKCAK